jgi:hypothetical protein
MVYYNKIKQRNLYKEKWLKIMIIMAQRIKKKKQLVSIQTMKTVQKKNSTAKSQEKIKMDLKQ